MYRQHLKMVLERDLESNTPRSQFVHRIISIPVVYLAWNIAAGTYNSLKSSNQFVAAYLNKTEKAILILSKPIGWKLEKQLKTADKIACKGLDAVEAVTPMVKHQKEKLYRQTKIIYDGTVESGLKKYETVKKISMSKFVDFLNEGTEKLTEFLMSPYGEVCEICVDFALEVGEMYVDHFLPPLGDERPEKLFGDRGKAPVPERVQLLKDRFQERFYKHTLLKVQLVRLRLKTLLFRLYRLSPALYLLEILTFLPGKILASISEISNWKSLNNTMKDYV